ncbi:MAG: hypothetical protein AAFP90_08075, partial [Planctomycetota bacterium]
GRHLDRGAVRDLVVRGDPRILTARQTVWKNDVFIALVIDCSGSMRFGDHMPKARRFAATITEACRPLEGIDARIFGFTDRVIYDAGTAKRPAIAALHADDGNNDAAALQHAAGVALQSGRSAKLAIMISDGLPTECSVDALCKLVNRLTTRVGICCAQVAVQPLEEVCFPHYVELTDHDINISVRRFGGMIANLIRRSVNRK